MNILHLNRFFLVVFVVITNTIFAQESATHPRGFSLNATLQSGIVTNIEANQPAFDNVFFAPNLRVLWKPNHHLNIGFETAYLKVSKQDSTLQSTPFGNTVIKARLNAIPLLLVFNMNFSKIDFFYGIGLSYATSKLEAFDQKVIVSNWYYCYNLAVAYHIPLTKNIDIGVETKTYFFPKLRKISSGIMLNFEYQFLKW